MGRRGSARDHGEYGDEQRSPLRATYGRSQVGAARSTRSRGRDEGHASGAGHADSGGAQDRAYRERAQSLRALVAQAERQHADGISDQIRQRVTSVRDK